MSFFKERVEIGLEEAELNTQIVLSTLPPFFKWFFIISALAIIPTYFVTKNISQKIWAKKYAAGAVMAKPSFTDPKPLVASKVSVSTMGENIYAATAKISNQNLDLSASNISYRFVFYNSAKEAVFTSPDDTFYILPNQTKYLTVPRFTANQPVAYTDLQIDDKIVWQKRLQIPQVKLPTTVPQTYQQTNPSAFVVEGEFTNQSPYQLGKVRLTFLLYDGENKIIGISQRDEFTLKPFERRAYKQLWPGVAASSLNHVEILTDTNTLDPNNITVINQPTGSSSDLGRPK